MEKINAVITGVGGYVPDYILTNEEISKMVDTNDEWIMTCLLYTSYSDFFDFSSEEDMNKYDIILIHDVIEHIDKCRKVEFIQIGRAHV